MKNLDPIILQVSFADALQALQEGKIVQRAGWNGKGLFVFKQVPADIPMEVVPNMQSLPQSVKNEFMRRFNTFKLFFEETGEILETDVEPILFNTIRYRNQFCMVYPDNTIYEWVPSANDICSNDWIIII